MQRVHVKLPGVPEGLTVYVTAYLPQADKSGERGELKLAVEAFGGVAVGNPRYSWMHKAIFNLPNTSAAIKELVTAYPTLKLRKNIAKIGAAPAAEPTLLPKRKPTEAPFFSPEHKMPWHAERKRCERAWAEAQQTVSSLITEVVKKTVPQLEGLNKRLRTKLDNLKAELKSANMSNSAFQKAKGKMQNSKKRRKKPFKSDASVVVKPRDVKEAAADLAAAVHSASSGATEVGVEVLEAALGHHLLRPLVEASNSISLGSLDTKIVNALVESIKVLKDASHNEDERLIYEAVLICIVPLEKKLLTKVARRIKVRRATLLRRHAKRPHGRDGPAAGLRAAGRRCGGHQRHDCQGRRILQRHNARAYLGIKQVILHTSDDDLP